MVDRWKKMFVCGRRPRLGLGVALGALVLFGSPVTAQLTWEATESQLEQDPDALTFQQEFVFENSGDYPLYIRSVKSLDTEARVRLAGRSKTIRPGNQGKVLVTYPNRLLFEEQVVKIEVQTDEREGAQSDLALLMVPEGWAKMDQPGRDRLKAERRRIAALESPVELSRRGVAWHTSEGKPAKGKQSVDVRFADGVEARVEGLKLIRGDASAFRTEIVEVVAGKHYRVNIEPLMATAKDASHGRSRSMLAAWRLVTSLERELGRRAALKGPLSVRAAVMPELRWPGMAPPRLVPQPE